MTVERHEGRGRPRATLGNLVGDITGGLCGHRPGTAVAVAVVHGDRLTGPVRLEILRDAPLDSRIEAIMDPAPRLTMRQCS